MATREIIFKKTLAQQATLDTIRLDAANVAFGPLAGPLSGEQVPVSQDRINRAYSKVPCGIHDPVASARQLSQKATETKTGYAGVLETWRRAQGPVDPHCRAVVVYPHAAARFFYLRGRRSQNRMPNHYTTMAVCSPGDEFDVEAFNVEYEEKNPCRDLLPMPEAVKATDDWYDWAMHNWGTKWGTYRVKAFDLDGDGTPILIKFQSAWTPPKILDKISAWLKETYSFEKVVFIGFNPYDCQTNILERF